MTLSHELRTPLNAVLGWTRMLSAGVLPKDSAAKALEKIERNAQAQARLVDDLLQVSRLTTGKFQLHTEAVDLAAIVRHAIDAIKSQADARQIAIITIGDAGPLPTAGDADRLQQVFWNILANAVKFSPVGSNVTISLRRDAGFDVVDIADEGIGIEPDFLPHVFDPFRQADASSTREHGGLGLGLSIVRRITDLHGGGVAARSAGRGRGATFTVTLPVRTSDQIAPAAEPRLTPPPPSALANTNVLVVDDNADAREILMALLGAAGAHARAASSVVEAMAHVDALPPDVVVTDIAMPDHDGYELLRRLRGEFGEAGPIVAIALTAHASEQERDRALAAGFQRHIVKPFDPASLVRTIEELVEKSKYSRNV
jgi:CheY-like chemotaxis protein/two-component sensor histidine kinase